MIVMLLLAAQALSAPSASKAQTEISVIPHHGAVDTVNDPLFRMPGQKKDAPVMQRPQMDLWYELAGQRYHIVSHDRRFVSIRGGDDSAPRNQNAAALRGNVVRKATGCLLEQAYWTEEGLDGRLNCDHAAIP